jgi:hypothetical protein
LFFLPEARHDLGSVHPGTHEFQRHLATQFRIPGEVHFAHAPDAEAR